VNNSIHGYAGHGFAPMSSVPALVNDGMFNGTNKYDLRDKADATMMLSRIMQNRVSVQQNKTNAAAAGVGMYEGLGQVFGSQ
jgi:hypothetical protein